MPHTITDCVGTLYVEEDSNTQSQAMELAESDQYHLYIESVRDDIAECSQQLQEKQLAITNALKQSEELTIDAAILKVRMKELEFDEELLKQSEDAAIKEKVLAEKKLMEVGGYERAVRMLQKALREANRELQDTKNEKVHIMSEEKKLHQELAQLNMILHKSRAASVKLQQEYDTAMKNKRETDEKLERLSLFLQKTIEAAAGQSPTKSQQQQHQQQLEQKESFLSPPSPLPSPTSINPRYQRGETLRNRVRWDRHLSLVQRKRTEMIRNKRLDLGINCCITVQIFGIVGTTNLDGQPASKKL